MPGDKKKQKHYANEAENRTQSKITSEKKTNYKLYRRKSLRSTTKKKTQPIDVWREDSHRKNNNTK